MSMCLICSAPCTITIHETHHLETSAVFRHKMWYHHHHHLDSLFVVSVHFHIGSQCVSTLKHDKLQTSFPNRSVVIFYLFYRICNVVATATVLCLVFIHSFTLPLYIKNGCTMYKLTRKIYSHLLNIYIYSCLVLPSTNNNLLCCLTCLPLCMLNNCGHNDF